MSDGRRKTVSRLWTLIRRLAHRRAALVTFLVAFLGCSANAGITYTNIFSFSGTNGASPAGTLVQGKDGKLYGTTLFGGPYNYGTVFRVGLDGTFTNLAWFDGTNGYSANQGLVEGANGNFYGATPDGGPGIYNYSASGTIYKITRDGVMSTLVAFDNTNGADPGCALILASDGNVYGTTREGGTGIGTVGIENGGTIFRISPDDTVSVVFNFSNTNQMGFYPIAGLIDGHDGYLYGMAGEGGSITSQFGVGFGTAFKMSLQGEVTFFAPLDGATAFGSLWPLVKSPDGNLYGTSINPQSTYGFGGEDGEVFRIAPNGSVTRVHSFQDTDGYYPRGILRCADGNLYGITGYNSFHNISDPNNGGNIFKLTPDGKFTILFSFDGTNGSQPFCALMQASDGNLYGTTRVGGLNGGGTIFRLSIPLPACFKSIQQSNDTVALTWSSVASQKYQVQYRTNPSDTNWSNLGDVITATNGTMTTCDQAEPGGQRYYRVVLIP